MISLSSFAAHAASGIATLHNHGLNHMDAQSVDTSGWSQHDKLLMYFKYEPSLAGAIFFTVMFALVTLIGLYQSTYLYPKPIFMHILAFSAALEAIGYGTRVQSIYHVTLAPFVVSVLFVLLAPILLALINYTTVGRLIEPTGKRIACINPRTIKWAFFASDFTGLVIQAIGGSVLASATTSAEYTLGSNITLVGLAVQVGFFTIFTYMMFEAAFGKDFQLYHRSDLKETFNILFVTTVLIYVRNIFRLIEYASPHTGYIPTNEWLYFVFESTPIFTACVIYCVWHFGRVLPSDILNEEYDSVSTGGNVKDSYNGKSSKNVRDIIPQQQQDVEMVVVGDNDAAENC